mmetsp:Transcript_29757/g.63210  ORF Transcript_29757/g.63210 Transcript_29757/m.63210 type:complete len:837 (+) Transcript_29757:104-2614(+)
MRYHLSLLVFLHPKGKRTSNIILDHIITQWRSRDDRDLLRLGLLLLLLLPHSVALDQVHQRVHRLLVRDALPHDLLPVVQVHLPGQRAHVPEVGVGHLPRAVHDASHHGHGHAREVTRRLLDVRRRLLQVEQGSSARGTAHELGLGVAHSASLEEGEAGVAEEVDAEVDVGADLLDEDSVPVPVREEGADLGPELEGELVGFGGVRLVVVDGGGEDVVGLEDLEDSAGGVELGEGWVDAHEDHDRIQVLHLGDGLVVLGPVDFHGKADGTLRQLSVGLDRLREAHERHGVLQGIRLQFLGRHDHSRPHLHHPPQRRPPGLVVRRGQRPHEDAVARGDVLEGHAHGRLEPELLVQVGGVALRQHRGRDGADDAAVVVEEEADVDRLRLLLLGEGAVPSRVREDVAGVDVGLHRLLTRGRPLVGRRQSSLGHFAEAVARRELELGILREAHPHRVPEPVGEEGPDSNGRLHPAILALAGLGHSQVQWVVPIQAVHLARQEAVALHHDERVGSLHGEDEVVVVLTAADVGELDGRLDHAAGGVSVVGQDATGEGAVVGPDAHAAVEFLALADEGEHGLDEVLALLDVIVLGLVHLVLEVLPPVGEVPRIDPNLLHRVGHQLGHLGLEVHVGTQRDVVPPLEQSLPNRRRRVGLPLSLHRDAHQVEPLVGASDDLLDAGVDVCRVGGRHGLSHDGMVGSELDGSAGDGAAGTADDAVEVLAVFSEGSDVFVAGAGLPGGGPEDVGRRLGEDDVGHVEFRVAVPGGRGRGEEGVDVRGQREDRRHGEGGDVHHDIRFSIQLLPHQNFNIQSILSRYSRPFRSSQLAPSPKIGKSLKSGTND